MTEQADKECGGDTTVSVTPENGSKGTSFAKQEQGESKEHNELKEPNHSTRSRGSPRRADEQDAPSRHLWVGNVSMSVTEAELAEQFSRFGDIESVTSYPARNYAFVNYKSLEDSVYAKKGLQGTVLGGLAIRIEFAKGAKPSRHIWIGNVSSPVTREQLEAECKKFGVVEDVRVLHDRNCAFVDFAKTDEAIAAFDNLNKKRLGTEELCVEYVKSQLQPKKDGRSDGHPRSDERADSAEPTEAHPGKTPSERSKRDRDDPSEILWVGFPLCMKVDERKLHKAFSPFGAIDKITTFAGRTYAFVQFHSVKAATRAKNVLQGKLFNDPRVSISFAKSEIGPVEHHARGLISPSANANMPPLLPSKPLGFVNPRGDRFMGFHPYGPSFRRRPEGDIDEGMFFRHEPGFRGDMDRPMRPWGSPALPEGAFIHPRHAPHLHQERWAFQEEAFGRHEHKRPRVGGNHSGRGAPVELNPFEERDESFQVVMAQDYVSKAARMSDNTEKGSMNAWEDSGLVGMKRPPSHRGQSPGPNLESSRPFKDIWPPPGISLGHSGEEFQWQGVIAKSGTTVCRARCYSIGKVTDFAFPEVVNCTARTSLDMLAKHISEVGEYYLVSFVPFGDLDVQWYQDFVVYLSEKKRAAVCKLSPESTLFLVPPSDFVEHFLKVPRGNNSIIGVFLKLQQSIASVAMEQIGKVQPMQMEANALLFDSHQKPMLQSSMEHKLPVMPPRQVSLHGMVSTEGMVFPPQSNVHSSSPASAAYASTVSAGTTSSFGQPNNLLSHDQIVDDRQPAYMAPPGYGTVPQLQPPTQHSTPHSGSLSFAPTNGDLHLSREQGMLLHSGIHISSSPAHYPTDQIHHAQTKTVGQSLSPFSQHPPLPQYPHPSTQQQKQPLPQNSAPIHRDLAASQLSSLMASQPPQPSLMQPPRPPGGTLLSHPQSQLPMAPTSGFTLSKEEWSMATTQVSHPPPAGPPQKDEGRGGVDTEQNELLQMVQQKLSEAKGEAGEDSKRFQATLELAAALLQQLQQKGTK